jgi:hypothetical protein
MTPLPFWAVAMVAPWPLACWLALCRLVPEPPPPGCLDSAVAEAASPRPCPTLANPSSSPFMPLRRYPDRSGCHTLALEQHAPSSHRDRRRRRQCRALGCCMCSLSGGRGWWGLNRLHQRESDGPSFLILGCCCLLDRMVAKGPIRTTALSARQPPRRRPHGVLTGDEAAGARQGCRRRRLGAGARATLAGATAPACPNVARPLLSRIAVHLFLELELQSMYVVNFIIRSCFVLQISTENLMM